MANEEFLERWEQEKQRLAALGQEWSFADALMFSMRNAEAWDHRQAHTERRAA